jgi:hypothetical protein
VAKSARLFDLAEDRLDERFAGRINCPPGLGLKLAHQAFYRRRIRG